MKATHEPMTYRAWQHVSWGNRIGIIDWEAGRLEGHLERTPRIGDHIRFRMESGKVLDTVITEVQTFSDPSDQFIATVAKIGYVDVSQQREYDAEWERRQAWRAALGVND